MLSEWEEGQVAGPSSMFQSASSEEMTLKPSVMNPASLAILVSWFPECTSSQMLLSLPSCTWLKTGRATSLHWPAANKPSLSLMLSASVVSFPLMERSSHMDQ